MAWVCVEPDGEELVFEDEPYCEDGHFWAMYYSKVVSLPPGSIKKLIGRELTWNDNPVMLEE